MRACQQRGIIQLINTFREAATEISGLLKKNNQAAAARLIADCAESAQGLRLFIEESEGAGTQTAELLGQFVEVASGPASELPKKMDKLLSRIEQTALQELKPNKIEIVFFPYKVSMWDSMESIWRAASQDPRCDAFVVPIPYYDRLPDGRLGQMHYEGHQYPDYVPVVDYRTYNTQERYPDAAFVHNPYDNQNYVTSVHPDYYTGVLRNFTDMLCYVPYFVTGSNIADHFCTCPGVIFSHKVFVESERVRELYLRAFGAHVKEKRIDRQFASEDKFVVTGSPKYDKVINSTPEEFTLPPEWRRLLERPDGTMKKSVLYNTSLGAMLNAGPHYIQKLKEVLAAFKERDDIVLWWRPHPLSDTTFQSMLPALREGYLNIVNQYKQDGFGIYDDTADLHRALCLTSAYFGDRSSLVRMYQLTGKPIMMQKAQVREGTSGPLHNITPGNLCECGGYYWFSTRVINALFRMDKSSHAIKYMGGFPGEPPFASFDFIDCIAIDGRIFFAPYSASAIFIFDTRSGAFERIELPVPENTPNSGCSYDLNSKFSMVLKNDEKLYFIPATYPGIIEYDTRNNELTVLNSWVDGLIQISNRTENTLFKSGLFEGDSLILPCACANAVVEINLVTRQHKIHRFSGNNMGYCDMCLAEGSRWLLPMHGAALERWNPKTGTLTQHVITSDKNIAMGKDLFQRVFLVNNNLLLLPYLSEIPLRFSPATQNVASVKGITPVAAERDTADFFSTCQYLPPAKYINGLIFIIKGRSNVVVEYDTHTDTSAEYALSLTPEDSERICKTFLESIDEEYEKPDDYLWYERAFFRVGHFLNLVTDDRDASRLAAPRKNREREIAHSDGKAGQAIYEVIYGEVFGK